MYNTNTIQNDWGEKMQDKKNSIKMTVAMILLGVVAILLTVCGSIKPNENTNTTIQSETLSDKTTTTTSESTIVIETTVATTIETTRPETTRPETTKKEEVKTTKKETTIVSAQNGTYTIPDNGGRFKSYTNYRLLSKSSPQWNKIQCHKDAYTDENGLRKVGNYYCVAMGSYYSSTLGDTFEITTEGGTFQVVLCDFKANQHTDSTNRYTAHNGCVIEFYVDMDSLNSTARQMGDISYADDKFSGRIINVTKTGNIFN